MGIAKEKLRLGERSFLEQITISARKLNMPVAVIRRDVIPGLGPLSGIYTAFKQNTCDAGLFLSCDMPLITREFLSELNRAFLKKRKALFTREQDKAGFPLILPASALSIVQQQLTEKDYSLRRLAHRLNAAFFPVAGNCAEQLINVNTPADYKRAQRFWRKAEQVRKQTVLEIKNVNVRRGTNHLVHDLDWCIKRGEHWVILGANGSGKTTLLNALLGYITPTSGEILLLGEEYGESEWPELRKKIGLVSSTIRQMMPESEPAWITVASGKYAMSDYWGTPKANDKKDALTILKQIECEYISERPWCYLSQGERQRALIGRALMAKPSLLILDEPCAGLDPAAREHFLQFLQRMARRRTAPSLVLVTHHVEEIMPIFTHVLLLKGGRKFGEGRVRDVLASSKLSDAFSSRIELRKQNNRYSLQVKGKRGVII